MSRSAPRRAGVLRRRAVPAGKGVVGLIVMVGVWELLRALDVLPRSAVPSTAEVLSAGGRGIGDGSLLSATGHTLEAWAIGLGLAVVIGAPLGVGIGLSRWADAATRDIIDFIRPIPSVAFVPVALVFLGFALKMEVVLIVVGAIWPIVFNCRYGVQDVDPQLLDSGRALHFSRAQVLRRIRLVAATPAMLTGLRTAATIALILAVSAEALAVPAGLGNVVAQASTTGNVADAYAAIVATGVIGMIINALIGLLRSRTVRWSVRPADGEA